MKTKNWLLTWGIIVALGLGFIIGIVYRVDPFFHYHSPMTDRFFYNLDNERSQNYGILEHFDYDAVITGTSMCENFKTSEMDELFGTKSVKVCNSGGTYKEINDLVVHAIEENPDCKTIVRGIDMSMFFDDSTRMRTELGDFPTYLYDKNIFNDVNYIFNKDVLFKRVYMMELARKTDTFEPGITSFDAYFYWQYNFNYGLWTVSPNGVFVEEPSVEQTFSDEEKEMLLDNINRNLVSVADANKDVTFYYFFTPYSALYWGERITDGSYDRYFEAEKLIAKELVKHDNIKLFSFNNVTEMTTNLNNYRDAIHYAKWANTGMLKWMKEGKYQLTVDNLEEELQRQYDFYRTFDFDSLNSQEDYEDDYLQETLFFEECK